MHHNMDLDLYLNFKKIQQCNSILPLSCFWFQQVFTQHLWVITNLKLTLRNCIVYALPFMLSEQKRVLRVLDRKNQVGFSFSTMRI
jgi:hypothetical protein